MLWSKRMCSPECIIGSFVHINKVEGARERVGKALYRVHTFFSFSCVGFSSSFGENPWLLKGVCCTTILALPESQFLFGGPNLWMGVKPIQVYSQLKQTWGVSSPPARYPWHWIIWISPVGKILWSFKISTIFQITRCLSGLSNICDDEPCLGHDGCQ